MRQADSVPIVALAPDQNANPRRHQPSVGALLSALFPRTRSPRIKSVMDLTKRYHLHAAKSAIID
jgi:hypothetical protein